MTLGRWVVAVILGSHVGPAPHADQKSCKPLPDPKRMPGLDGVADSAALLRRLAAVDSVPGELSVSVWYADHPAVYPIDAVMPLSAAHSAVLDAVAASLRPAEENAPPSLRLATQP